MIEKNRMRASSRSEDPEENTEEQEVGCCGRCRMSHSKKFFLLFGCVVVLLVLVVAGAVLGVVAHNIQSYAPYSAVYLTSGDVYFGKFKMYPRPSIENPAYLQRVTDQGGQAQLSLVPLSAVPWQPTNEMYVNRDQILFWVPLEEGSDFMKKLSLIESQWGTAQTQTGTPGLGTGMPSDTVLPTTPEPASTPGQ